MSKHIKIFSEPMFGFMAYRNDDGTIWTDSRKYGRPLIDDLKSRLAKSEDDFLRDYFTRRIEAEEILCERMGSFLDDFAFREGDKVKGAYKFQNMEKGVVRGCRAFFSDYDFRFMGKFYLLDMLTKKGEISKISVYASEDILSPLEEDAAKPQKPKMGGNNA